MNERFEERIFELAKQAGMLRDKFGLYWNAHDNPDDGVDLEKFAELIVEECGRVADVFCDIWCEEDKPHDVTVSNYIKRHVLRADPE